MRKLLCSHCNEVVEIDVSNAVNYCPNCGQPLDTISTINSTKAYVQNVYKTAVQLYESAYSFDEAYRYYKEFLKFDPKALDAIIGKFLSLIKTSSLKKNVFNKFIEDFNNSDIVLEKTTYIRLGHFFEELMNAVFVYQKRIIEFSEVATEAEKELAYNNIVDLLGFYNFIEENINMFTDEEYADSIFISKEEFKLNKEKLMVFMRDSNSFKYDIKELSSAEIFVNNKKIIHSEFDYSLYDEVQDCAFFYVMKGGYKSSYLVFGILILFVLMVVAGVIVIFTAPTIQWLAWTLIGIGAAGSVITYILFTKKRNKEIAALNK